MTTHTQAVRRASPRTDPRPHRSRAACCRAAAGPVPRRRRHAAADARDDYAEPAARAAASRLYRRMVIGRRFDIQATALTKQGRLAVYPSSRGQEACQVGAVLALQPRDWVFPTYRESMALVARGIDPVEVLTLLRGDWHCGYDPAATSAPAVHAAGHPAAARRRAGLRRDAQGPRHRRAGVHRRRRHQRGRLPRGAQLRRRVQGAGRLLRAEQPVRDQRPAVQADRGAVAGVQGRSATASPREQVDGNDPVAVLAVLDQGGGRTPAPGNGPFLVEAHTYRMDAAHQRRRRHALPRRGRGRRWLRPRPDRPAGDVPARRRACSTTRRSRRSPAEAEASPPTCGPA